LKGRGLMFQMGKSGEIGKKLKRDQD
jgi:hypothetical protein